MTQPAWLLLKRYPESTGLCNLVKNVLLTRNCEVVSVTVDGVDSTDLRNVSRVVYFHNKLSAHQGGARSGAITLDEFYRITERLKLPRALSIYPRSEIPRYPYSSQSPTNGKTHYLHVFCDEGILGPSSSTLFLEHFSSRVVDWLTEDSSMLRSGTFINVTENVSNGNCVAGVISGGAKLPLGAQV